MSKKKKGQPEDMGGDKPRRVEDFLDDILGNGPRGTDGLLSQLAQRPNLGMGLDRKPAALTPIRNQPQPPRTNPFEGLPEIPGISPVEHKARVLLHNTLSEEMYKMIGAWLVVEQIKEDQAAEKEHQAGDTRRQRDAGVSPEAFALQQRFEKGEVTSLCMQDAWNLGSPIIEKLFRLARKPKDEIELEQKLSEVFARCRFDIAWQGEPDRPLPPEDRLEDFSKTTKGLLRGAINHPEKEKYLQVAQRLAFQCFEEEDETFLRRVADDLRTGKTIATGDVTGFSEKKEMLLKHFPLGDELNEKAKVAFAKALLQEKLTSEEAKTVDAAIACAFQSPALTRDEVQFIEQNPGVNEYANMVVQIGFSRFGDLMMASNHLQGYMTADGGSEKGAFAWLKEYNRLKESSKPYKEQAEAHRQAIALFERSREHLAEVKNMFSHEDLRADVPQPDPAVLEAAQASLHKRMDERSDRKGPLYHHVSKPMDRLLNKLPRHLQENASYVANALVDIPASRNRSMQAYCAMFDQTVADFCQMLRDKATKGEAYDVTDDRHKDMIFALQEMQGGIHRQLRITGESVAAVFQQERESQAGNKEYMELLSELEKAAQALNGELQERLKPVDAAVESLLSNVAKVHKEGVTEEQAVAAAEAGNSDDWYEFKRLRIDDMTKAALASDRMLDHAETIIAELKKRQAVLDQYAQRAAQMSSHSGGGGGAVGGGFGSR